MGMMSGMRQPLRCAGRGGCIVFLSKLGPTIMGFIYFIKIPRGWEKAGGIAQTKVALLSKSGGVCVLTRSTLSYEYLVRGSRIRRLLFDNRLRGLCSSGEIYRHLSWYRVFKSVGKLHFRRFDNRTNGHQRTFRCCTQDT
jgi:hypothetical protein